MVEVVVDVVDVGVVVHCVMRLQSTDTSPVVAPKKVITLVVGQLNPTTNVVNAVHSVSNVTAGVAKTISLTGGHVIVDAGMVAGKVTVVTVEPDTVTVDVMPE